MNNKFETNIINIYGSKGKQWLKDLPNIIAKIAQEWGLTDLKPIDNLSINYVVSGFQNSQEIILKLSLDKDLINKEYIALTALNEYGAVEVLNHKEKTLLLKKLSPATSLKTYLPSRRIEALKIACEVTKKLHQAPILENINLPTIEERFSLLDKDWQIPSDFLSLARKFRNEIFSKYQIRKVLHGDLHHDNILQDGDDWKIIDPHGVIGFPINEVWSFVHDIDEDIPFIANYFGFPIDDIKKCYLMHSILSSICAIEDNMDPKFWLDLALKIKKKI
jgi:streptomycin 6-kinase